MTTQQVMAMMGCHRQVPRVGFGGGIGRLFTMVMMNNNTLHQAFLFEGGRYSLITVADSSYTLESYGNAFAPTRHSQ